MSERTQLLILPYIQCKRRKLLRQLIEATPRYRPRQGCEFFMTTRRLSSELMVMTEDLKNEVISWSALRERYCTTYYVLQNYLERMEMDVEFQRAQLYVSAEQRAALRAPELDVGAEGDAREKV